MDLCKGSCGLDVGVLLACVSTAQKFVSPRLSMLLLRSRPYALCRWGTLQRISLGTKSIEQKDSPVGALSHCPLHVNAVRRTCHPARNRKSLGCIASSGKAQLSDRIRAEPNRTAAAFHLLTIVNVEDSGGPVAEPHRTPGLWCQHQCRQDGVLDAVRRTFCEKRREAKMESALYQAGINGAGVGC